MWKNTPRPHAGRHAKWSVHRDATQVERRRRRIKNLPGSAVRFSAAKKMSFVSRRRVYFPIISRHCRCCRSSGFQPGGHGAQRDGAKHRNVSAVRAQKRVRREEIKPRVSNSRNAGQMRPAASLNPARENADGSTLEFWKEGEIFFPNLPPVALDLVSAPAVQDFVERISS